MYSQSVPIAAFLALSVLHSHVSAATLSTCLPNMTEPNVPLLRLGGVDTSRSCEIALTPLFHQCHTRYFEAVRQAYVQVKCYEGAESVRKAMCCSLWEAKECMVQASSGQPDCGDNTTELYRALPGSVEEREHLLDRCSEYGEGVPACEVLEKANFSMGLFVTILLVFISLPAIAFGLIKAHQFYQDYKTFKQEEAQKQAQRRGTLDNFDDSLPLNETTVDYHDNEITKDGIPKDELTQ